LDFVRPPFLFVLVDGLLAPRLYRAAYRRYAESIELKGSEAALDFGCGSGGVAEHLAPRITSGSLTCVDISPPMLAIARRRLRRYPNTHCHVGGIESLDLAAESLDVVVIHNALHDVPAHERVATAKALARLLRPGGRLCFREPTRPPHGIAPDGYRELMKAAGLEEHHGEEAKSSPVGAAFTAVFTKPLEPEGKA
jgi:ubiquinone/menaquinone biosynthesis C-methylase UbiE